MTTSSKPCAEFAISPRPTARKGLVLWLRLIAAAVLGGLIGTQSQGSARVQLAACLLADPFNYAECARVNAEHCDQGKHIYYSLSDDHVRELIRAALVHAGEPRVVTSPKGKPKKS